jgi:tRNA-splicing ligase RtcB
LIGGAQVDLEVEQVVENHHNFAWKEAILTADGHYQKAIVHRKGATPAGIGVLGMIPGSMADPGFVVEGKGVEAALNSAAHGAGRAMGRRVAQKTISPQAHKDYLFDRSVTLIGGGLDEAPQAYKRIEQVMDAQKDLVRVVGTFTPRVVRMAGEPGEY